MFSGKEMKSYLIDLYGVKSIVSAGLTPRKPLFTMGDSRDEAAAAGEEWICESGDGCARWVAWC